MSSSSTSSFDPPARAPIGRKSAFLFVGGLILLLGLINEIGGFRRDLSVEWAGPVRSILDTVSFQVYFFGSSRVSAAVDVAAFDSTMAEFGHPGIRSINLGMGYSRLNEYYMLARYIVSRKPNAFRGATILLEAPLGLAEYSTWDDNWMVADGVENLAPYLRAQDLPSFLRRSASTPLAKAQVVAQVLFGFRENYSRLRYHTEKFLTERLAVSKAIDLPSKKIDLVGVGGIRTDSQGVDAVKEIAVRFAKTDLKNQVPQRHYDTTILKQFIDVVQDAGGRVRLFRTPLSSVQAAPFETPIRRKDKASFLIELADWKVPLLDSTIATTDSDFPDYWHLRRSRAPEFSRHLAIMLLQSGLM